jgi:hypothetical protein
MNDSTLECKRLLGVDYPNLEKKLTLLQDKSDALLRNLIIALGSDTYGYQLKVCDALRDEDISLDEFEVILKSSDDDFHLDSPCVSEPASPPVSPVIATIAAITRAEFDERFNSVPQLDSLETFTFAAKNDLKGLYHCVSAFRSQVKEVLCTGDDPVVTARAPASSITGPNPNNVDEVSALVATTTTDDVEGDATVWEAEMEFNELHGDVAYGFNWVKRVLFITMVGGGAHAWGYKLVFTSDDEYKLYITSLQDEEQLQRDKLLANSEEGKTNYVKVVDSDYVFDKDEERFWIYGSESFAAEKEEERGYYPLDLLQSPSSMGAHWLGYRVNTGRHPFSAFRAR